MRTTVELDDTLVADARKYLGIKTLNGAIEYGLREAIRAKQREALIRSMGTFGFAYSHEELKRIDKDKEW